MSNPLRRVPGEKRIDVKEKSFKLLRLLIHDMNFGLSLLTLIWNRNRFGWLAWLYSLMFLVSLLISPSSGAAAAAAGRDHPEDVGLGAVELLVATADNAAGHHCLKEKKPLTMVPRKLWFPFS